MLVSANEMSQYDTSNKLLLYLFTKSHGSKTVVATKNSFVSILDLLYKNVFKNPIYIHNGSVLLKSRKFSAYTNLQNEANIFVTEDKNEYLKVRSNLDNLFKAEKQRDSFMEIAMRGKAAADNSFRMEMSRLNDIRLTRQESKRKMRRCLNENNISSNKDTTMLAVPDKREISTQPFPKFW